MAKVTRFDAAIGQLPGRAENVAQQRMLGTLAERLKGFADRRNRSADIQAEEEGRRMGEVAAVGTIGGVEIPEDFTIRDRAFSEGARNAHAAQIQVEIRETVSKLERENMFDVGAFTTQLDGYRGGLISEIDEQLQPAAIKEINDYALRSRIRIEDNIFKQVQSENLASITSATEGMADDALTAAYQGDNDMLMTKTGQFMQVLDNGVIDGSLDRAAVEEQKRNFNDDVTVRQVTGVFDRTLQEVGLEAGETAFDKFTAAKHKGVDPELRDRIITRMRSSLSHERSKVNAARTRQNAELKAREQAIKRDIDNAEFALDHGYQVPDVAELIDVSRGTKYEDDIRLVQLHQDAVNDFVQMSPSKQAEFLNKQDRKRLSGEQVRLVERLRKVQDHTLGEIRAGRGMDLALSQGIIEELPPLEAPGALAARKAAAQTASQHYEQPISPLTKDEIDGLKANLDRASSDERIVTLGQLVDGLGEDSLPMLENLGGKNAGVYAVAGDKMLNQQGTLGREILQGIDAQSAFPKIVPTDFDTLFNEHVGDTYTRTPKQAEIVRDATRSLYAQQSANMARLEEPTTDSSIMEYAVNSVTGGIYKLQEQGSGLMFDTRYNLEAPAPGIEQDEFIDWIENLSQDDIRGMGNDTDQLEAVTESINDMQVRLISLGDGEYQVLRRGFPLVNGDLSPVLIRWPK